MDMMSYFLGRLAAGSGAGCDVGSSIEYAKVTERAMLTGQYGIYISYGEGIHAYHGNLPLDYDLCKELDVRVVELNYAGGTIIGSADDFSIIIVSPETMGLTHEVIIEKFVEIIGKYVPNTTYDGNDILVNGEKVAGSMIRIICGSWVWATQVTFNDYSEYIEKLCHKPSNKKPAYIDNSLLTRDLLEQEILAWLQKSK